MANNPYLLAAAPIRRYKQPVAVDEEDAKTLKLGADFQVSYVLSNAEALLLLSKGAGRSALAAEIGTGTASTEVFGKSLEYAKRFARFSSTDLIKEMKNLFPLLAAGQAIDDSGFHVFEVAQIMNLCPETTEDAKSLIPTLERFQDANLKTYIDEMNALRHTMRG